MPRGKKKRVLLIKNRCFYVKFVTQNIIYMIHLLLLFTLTLLLSSIFINGFYNITRGQWVAQPNGSKKWVGKIFSFWSKLLQNHTVKKEFYKGNEFYKQVAILQEFFAENEIIEVLESGVVVEKLGHKRMPLFEVFAASKNILFTIRDYGSGKIISVYTEQKEYTFPNLIRAPFGECLACMSSAYGTICFFGWYNLASAIQYFYPTKSVEALLSINMGWKVFLWVTFCISLAYLNETIFNVNHKLSK